MGQRQISGGGYTSLEGPLYLSSSLRKQPSFFAAGPSGVSRLGPGAKKDGCFLRLLKLKPVWNLTAYRHETKLKIFKSNVLAVLLYGAETWKMTEHDALWLERFQRGKIFRISCPEKITNKDLYKNAGMMPVSDMIKERHWRWLGHVLRLEDINNVKVPLTWSPEGGRKR